MHAIGAALLANAVKTPAESATLHAEAKTAAATAIRLDPRAAKAYSALAINEGVWRNEMQHNWFAEEHYLQQALKYDPKHAESFFGRGSCFDALDQHAKALEDYDAALAINNKYSELW